jgi:putative lipoprotein
MKRALAALLAVVALACSGSDTEETVDLVGVVTYRERVALPPTGVEVEVRLVDAGRGRTVESVLLRDPGQVPIPFRLSYGEDELEADGTYVLDATIRVDGRVAWLTRDPVPVVPGTDYARGVQVVVTQP